jgi:hypothetical protein
MALSHSVFSFGHSRLYCFARPYKTFHSVKTPATRQGPAPLLALHPFFSTTQVCTKNPRKARQREGETSVPSLGFLGASNFPGRPALVCIVCMK